MQPSAVLLVSTTVLAIVGLAPPLAESAPVHGGFGVRLHGPHISFGIGFPSYHVYPRFPYSYYRYRAYPYYYRSGLYIGSYPSVAYAPYVPHPSWQGYYPGSGAVRMMVDAKEAEVFVDGYYAGIVDDFDGTFQKLYLQPGEHVIELRLEGHRTFTQRILISPGHTQKLHHRMQPLLSGETSEPTGPQPPSVSVPPPPLPDPAPAPAPSPSAAVIPGEFGVLRLRVQPAEGEIHIDAEPWGELGGLEEISIHLPAGTHRIELRRAGTPVFEADVQIRPGESTPLNIRFP